MKTLTPTEYQSLSEEHFDAELVAIEYAKQYPGKDYHDLMHAVLYGIIAYSKHLSRLKEPTKAEAETVEQAAPNGIYGALVDLGVCFEPPVCKEDESFTKGAIFGANWQASNTDNISRARVIEIINQHILNGHGIYESARLIEKIKAS